MVENKINLHRHAMSFGTYMGVYWIAKFSFFPLGLTNPLLLFLFIGLTLAVPFLGFRFARTFRDNFCGGEIGFFRSWIFLVLMFLFASLLTAAAHYIYFRYIDNDYIINVYAEMLKAANLESIPGFDEYIEPIKESIKHIRSMSAIEIAMQLLSQNMFYCSIISLIIAPFVMKKKAIVS